MSVRRDVVRILIVYANPAVGRCVAPYGAEKICRALADAGCEPHLLSPFLQLDPLLAMRDALRELQPDLVGFSVRNIDDTLIVRAAEGSEPLDTTFYLPAIRPLVEAVQERQIPLLFGGSAMSCSPLGILRYFKARFGIRGPAEDLMRSLGKRLAAGERFPAALPDDPRVIDVEAPLRRTRVCVGRTAAEGQGWAQRSNDYLELLRYREGFVAVQMAFGCNRHCLFCVESSQTQPWLRPIDDLIAEIGAMQQAGAEKIWLAASELNVPDCQHATAVLHAIAATKLPIDVMGFVQPAPIDEPFLDALEAAGVDPTTLSFEFGHLDDELLAHGAGPAQRKQLDGLVELFLRRGYPTMRASILLGAHPKETWASVDRALQDLLSIADAFPAGIDLTYGVGGRVFSESQLGAWVKDNLAEARADLYGTISEDFVEPLVFCRPTSPRELFAYATKALEGLKGRAGAMNAEASEAELQASVRVNQAISLLVKGEYRRSADMLAEALVHAPSFPVALKLRSLVLAHHLDEEDAAAQMLQQLVGEPVRLLEPLVDEVVPLAAGEKRLPRVSPAALMVEVGEGAFHLIHSARGGRLHQEVGETVADVFELARLGVSRSAGIEALATTYELDPSEAEQTLQDCLDVLAALGLLRDGVHVAKAPSRRP